LLMPEIDVAPHMPTPSVSRIEDTGNVLTRALASDSLRKTPDWYKRFLISARTTAIGYYTDKSLMLVEMIDGRIFKIKESVQACF
jgi:hypothetical protein